MIASLSKGSSLEDVLHGGFNEHQLAAYVSWVNSQLKRKPGLKPISNLRLDLQDGVVLSHLIEIVAGEVLEGVHPSPRDKEESRKNVEHVLHFISSKHIRMPHISAKDIVDGNLKSLMRIILALAAHFKPSANHRAASGAGRNSRRAQSNHNPHSAVALAQGAAAALASARHDASLPVRHSHLRSGFGLDEEGSVCVRALVKQYERGAPEDPNTTQPSSLSSISPLASPRAPDTSQSDVKHTQDSQSQQDSVQLLSTGGKTTWDEAVGESLEKEMEEARKMVSALQALLLNGALPEEEEQATLQLEEDDAQQLVVVRSRLDQSMEEVRVLKRELLCCKQEMRNLQGVKEAQQQRLCVQEASILQMKQEVLRSGMAREELVNQNAELQWKLEECTRLWSECKKEVGQKDRLLQQHKQKLEESQKQHGELQRELEHKTSLLQSLRRQDNQQISTDSDNNGYCQTGSPSSSWSGQAEELQLVRDAVRSLRNSFRDQDPQHHTLDTLEQGVSSLIDRLSHTTQQGRSKSPRHRTTSPDQDPWPTKISHSFSGSSSTKVLYFTNHSPTPSMVHIPKRLGEVTLKDVKEAVDCKGNLRYHFKALDPEFGTVKEELFLDGAVVPGWEGKIVAWVEEDHGEDRPP
ncbi:dixin-like isoform X1 [Gadus macrocephalus]|uniref:dixin-like isoform X1 n=1 Tax=Gadus macrocephalus TaxID=80720 RepID=UPI0028CB95A8|nr:dixin-like isoform X1 [Gadus macrocephalus]